MIGLFIGYIVCKGTLTFTDCTGRTRTYGDGGDPRVALRLTDRRTEYSLVLKLPLAAGEAYMDGRLVIERGSLDDFFELAAINYAHFGQHWLGRLTLLLSKQAHWIKQHNPIGQAQKNVAHHYDLSARLYDLFLDRDRQYSCAYFTHPENSLEQAQEDKKRHLAAKLLLDRPGTGPPGHWLGMGRARPLHGAGRRLRRDRGHP